MIETPVGFHEAMLEALPNHINPSDRVLDVGGWHAPLNRADYVVDIMPYATRNRNGALLKEVWPSERFSKDTFLPLDICRPEPWPFKDKFFDFVFCSNTLEDVRDPVRVCSEMVRVGRAGLIEVPSRLVESIKGVERPFYTGYYHHRWLCEVENNHIFFQFKPAMIHSYRRFHFVKPWYKRVNHERYGSAGFFWKESFQYSERVLIERDEVQESLTQFKAKHGHLRDLFVHRF